MIETLVGIVLIIMLLAIVFWLIFPLLAVFLGFVICFLFPSNRENDSEKIESEG